MEFLRLLVIWNWYWKILWPKKLTISFEIIFYLYVNMWSLFLFQVSKKGRGSLDRGTILENFIGYETWCNLSCFKTGISNMDIFILIFLCYLLFISSNVFFRSKVHKLSIKLETEKKTLLTLFSLSFHIIELSKKTINFMQTMHY